MILKVFSKLSDPVLAMVDGTALVTGEELCPLSSLGSLVVPSLVASVLVNALSPPCTPLLLQVWMQLHKLSILLWSCSIREIPPVLCQGPLSGLQFGICVKCSEINFQLILCYKICHAWISDTN